MSETHQILEAQKHLTDVHLSADRRRIETEIKRRANEKAFRLSNKSILTIGFAGWGLDAMPPIVLPYGHTYRVVNVNKTQLMAPLLDEQIDILLVNHNFLYDAAAAENVARVTRRSDKPIITVLWLLDHHHMYEFSLNHISHFDYYCRSHYFGTDYLSAFHKNCLGTLPCPVMQWSLSNLDGLTRRFLGSPRSDALYAGFRVYGHPRDEFARICQEQVKPNKIFLQTLEESQSSGFFSMSGEDRFADWCGYKASLVLTVRNDIPSRIFDALLTGQIPIVSDDVVALDTVIPIAEQLNLPVLRFRNGDVDHVKHVHKLALDLFDKMGMEGVERRSRYALANHTVQTTLQTVAQLLESEIRVSNQSA